MKCLTIMEPFAWLIVDAVRLGIPHPKDIENRKDRFGTFAGQLLIHSAKDSARRYTQNPLEEWLDTVGEKAPPGFWPYDLDSIRNRGIIGVVYVANTVFVDEINPKSQWHNSLWAEGPRCLLINEVYPFDKHIPFRGQQGLFDVPDHLVADAIELAMERRAIQESQ